MEDSSKRTALADQKPLPDVALTPTDSASDGSPSRRWTHDAAARTTDEPEDMHVDSSDAEHPEHADHNDGTVAGSDAESASPDEPKTGKKKRTQRFYCTDYPPCNLSFTRSEHLARHIRKHTGERPFQCHCSRRFSRLDNLRQHAQTVHINEDIPIDSLAASGARYQRQGRNDRVRPSGSVRVRPNSSASLVVPMRGHSKALSTSSLASNLSVGSTLYAAHDDMRHRPAPLVMADPRSRTPIMESYRPRDVYMSQSPSEYATPVSATYSNAPLSPHWEDGMVSPSSARSRPHSMYATLRGSGSGRRLSMPSAGGGIFLQSPPTATRTTFSHGGPVSYSAPTGNEAGGPLASPTASSASTWSRRDSVSSTADADWRRRTWHPDSREFPATNGGVGSPPPAPSRLSHGMPSSQYPATPTTSLPIANPAAQTTGFRLPGIESFDPLPRFRPSTPPSTVVPPAMAFDSDSPHRSIAFEPSSGHHRDFSLNRGLTRLEIDSGSSPRNSASAWADDVNRAAQTPAEPTMRSNGRAVGVHFEGDNRVVQIPYGSSDVRSMSSVYAQGHQHTASAPSFSSATSRQQRRQGWYNGPRDQRVERMVHPNLANGFSGFPARVPQTVHEHPPSVTSEPQQQQQQQPPSQQPHYPDHGRDHRDEAPGISRLDALVAAAAQASTAAY